MASASPDNPVTMRRMLPIIGASTLGTTIEWYDFFLYGFFSATVFAKLFFPTLNPLNGTIAAFTTNFVGFAARPIGGAFFGWFGDRVGRKSTLIATLLLMGIATFLMGFLPGYTTIGLAAPILLSILRFLQGAGVGGEWGGSVLLSMEYSDNQRRGFWSSWPQTGVPFGLALAAIAVLVFTAAFPGSAFLTIGWRIPFFFSALLVLVGLFIRLRILETPAFRAIKEARRVARVPLTEAFAHYWREIVLVALARSGEQAPFYLFTTFVLAYGVETLKVGSGLLYVGIIVAAIVELFTIPTFSSFSDTVGRRRWYLIGSVLMFLWAFAYFPLLGTKNPMLIVLAIALSVGIFHAWIYGPQAALFSEQFGTKLRYSGVSLGYQLASITAGGPAPILATYLLANHAHLAPGLPAYGLIALYIAAMALISFLAVLGLGEYARRAAAEDVEVMAALAPTD
jgi:MFS family permease